MSKYKEFENVALGILDSALYVSKSHDRPEIAANMIHDLLIENEFMDYEDIKKLARTEQINLSHLWSDVEILIKRYRS